MVVGGVAAIPYIQIQLGSGFLNFFAVMLVGGLGVGLWAVAASARRAKLPDAVALAAICIGPAIVCAHLFDVVVYRLGDVSPALLVRLNEGVSLFGALIGVGATTWIWVVARGRAGGAYADVIALGCLVATAVGRVGCALVHDHPGVPTDSPVGVDFPAQLAWHVERTPRFDPAATIRLHDLGLEELVLLLPLVAIALVLARRALRPGLLAVIIAVGYAAIRFPLEFLRAPATEPTRLGLTGGQWSCIVLALLAGAAAAWWMRRPRAA